MMRKRSGWARARTSSSVATGRSRKPTMGASYPCRHRPVDNSQSIGNTQLVTATETLPEAVPSNPQRRSLLRNPDFMRLWTGETISQLGTQITVLAIPLVAIEVLQATTLQ